MKAKEPYIPSIGEPSWDISNISKEERAKIKGRLVARLTHSEDEYRAVIAYLHKKFPKLMDVNEDDGALFQWRYNTFCEKVKAYDTVGKKSFDMYGLVYYDPDRDMEPVAVGGSYIRETGAIRDPYTHKIIEGQIINIHTTKIRCGHGYILFVDPAYRRMGLAADQWLTEAQLYRDSGIHYQKENQTYAALQVTLSMFKDKNKVHIISKRPLNQIKEGMNTKIIMDYFDSELTDRFESMPEGLKDFRGDLDWRFLERENLSITELIAPWVEREEKRAKKVTYNSDVSFTFKVNRDLLESFKRSVDGNVKEALTDYMRAVTIKNFK